MLDLLVPLEVAGMGEASVADRTAEGPISGVHVAVNVQLALAHKALATQQASVELFPGVSGNVLLQVRLQEEALGAACAAIWAFHGDALVESQVETAGQGFVVGVVGVAYRPVQNHAVCIIGGVDSGSGSSTTAGCSWSVSRENRPYWQRGLHLHWSGSC